MSETQDDAIVKRVAWAIHVWSCPLCMLDMDTGDQEHVTSSDLAFASFLKGVLGLHGDEDAD